MIVNHFPIGSRNNKRKDVEIIATNADILNQILSQYYPEKFAGRRNSLNYPVGQFILKLHEMYHDGELILNVDILMGVFSSDWLSDKKPERMPVTILPICRDFTFFSTAVNLSMTGWNAWML